MANVVCPSCGNEQDGGIQCRQCFALLSEGEEPVAEAPRRPILPVKRKPAIGMFQFIYRLISLASLVVLVIAIVLIFRKSPAPQVSTDPRALGRAESKLIEAKTAAEIGHPHPLRLDEAEVNAYLDANLGLKQDPLVPRGMALAAGRALATTADPEPSVAEVQSSVKDVRINLHDDRVQAYVVFDFHGQDLSLALDGRLRVENGYLRFEPTSGKLGSLPIPQSTLESAVERLLSSPENVEKMRVPPDIADIQVQNGELVLTNK